MKEKMTGKMMVTTQLMVTVLLMQLMVMVSEISTAEMMTEPISAIAKEEWELFKLKHNKTYGDINEETVRMNIFMENKLQVIEHNKLYEQNLTTFQMDTNHLSDMLVHEVVAVLNGYRGERDESQGSVYIPPEDDFIKLPRSIDWRTRNIVTRVKNQGQCGSCWAFAATGALEGQHARKTGYLVNLSEQDLVDCCSLCYGCQGGLMTQAYRCIFMDGGINSEFDYPYIARDSMCKYNRNMAVATVTGYAEITSGNESALMNAVALVGPVAVGIDAGHPSFQHYRSGVYYEPHCSSTEMNHGVLVVGYGTYWGVDYWLVKNSWTTNWGDQGYMKIARNRRNMCGIATAASFPFV